MGSLKDVTILYIEDDENTRKAMETFLMRRAGSVYSTALAKEGMELYRKYNPDIIITDLLMPDMSGWNLIREIRKNDLYTKIVVTSTVDDVSKVLDAVNLRIDAYMNKPINPNELELKLIALAGEVVAYRKRRVIKFVENKPLVEEDIRKAYNALLKSASGNGGKEVNVRIGTDTVTIIARKSLNSMEKTMLKSYENWGEVNESRRLFFKTIEQNIENMVSGFVGCSVKVTSVDVNSGKETDTIILTAYDKR